MKLCSVPARPRRIPPWGVVPVLWAAPLLPAAAQQAPSATANPVVPAGGPAPAEAAPIPIPIPPSLPPADAMPPVVTTPPATTVLPTGAGFGAVPAPGAPPFTAAPDINTPGLAEERQRASAQAPELSLVDVIALALENNPQPAAARAALAAARARIGTARSAGGLQASLGGNANFNRAFGASSSGGGFGIGGTGTGTGGTGDGTGTGATGGTGGSSSSTILGFTHSESVGPTAQLPLYTGGRVKASTQVAEFNAQAQAAQAVQVEQDLVLSVTAAYLNVLRSQQLLDVAASNLAVSRERQRVALVRYNAGAAARLEVLTANTTVANAQQRRIAASNALGAASANLNTLMGRVPETPLRIQFVSTLTPRLSLPLTPEPGAAVPPALPVTGAGAGSAGAGAGSAGTGAGTPSGTTTTGTGALIPGPTVTGPLTPGTMAPGGTTPGTVGPGATTTSPVAPQVAPIGTAPGTPAPGNPGTPATGAPGTTTSGITAPGATMPGVVAPGITTPGVTSPGVTTPGVTTPNVGTIGATTPGTTTPGATAPGTATSGTTTPPVPALTPETVGGLGSATTTGTATPSTGTPGTTIPTAGETGVGAVTGTATGTGGVTSSGLGLPSSAQLRASVGTSRSSLAVTEAQLRAAQANVDLARAQRKPSVGLSLSGLLRNPATLLGRFALGLGLSVAQTLFDSGRSKSQITEAQALVEQLRQQLAGQKLEVANAIEQSLLTLDSAQQQLASADAAVAEAGEALRAAQLGYEAGARTSLDVSDAQAALLTTQTTAVNSRFDVATAQAQLAASVGVLTAEGQAAYNRALQEQTEQLRRSGAVTQPAPAQPARRRRKFLGIF